MSRWKAATIHLSISILIGLLVLSVVFLVWYPQPYFTPAGGQRLMSVLLCVHLAMGPLLTLIIFKSGKKGLLLDLGMIATLQAAALFLGLVVIAQARPVFIVAAVDRFNLVSAADLDSSDLAMGSKPEFRTLAWTGPRLVGAQMPSQDKERTDLIFESISGGKDVQHYPRYYVDYESVAADLRNRAKPIAELRDRKPESAPLLDAWLEEKTRKDDEVVWAPIMVRKSSLVMLLDAKTGEVLAALPINPW